MDFAQFVVIALALSVPSVLIWLLLSAVVFRFTKTEGQHGPTNMLFFVLMLVSAGAIYQTHTDLIGVGAARDVWLFWTFWYCASAATLMGMYMLGNFLFGTLFNGAIRTIRGK